MTEEHSDLVAKRQRFIERQIDAHPDVVDVDFEGQSPVGTGPSNRHGMPRLPVDQREVPHWPVLDLGVVPHVSRAEWQLEVGGLVENPVSLAWQDFMALPQVEDTSDFHCVTGWSRMDNRWCGVTFRALAELVVPTSAARFVTFTGYDHEPGSGVPYTTNLPLVRALDPDVMLVHTWEGEDLAPEHGGPCRVITPRLYAWKGTKWVRRVEFVAGDDPGFWEVRGYSNTGEPWFNDRYSR